jgi:hypothetical protein
MVIKGSILTPIAKLVTIKGLVVGLFIRYGLKVEGGRTSLRSPNPSGSTRSNHPVGSRLAPSRSHRRGNHPSRRLFDRSSTEH